MNFKKSLTEGELEAILAPHLRLFLSVDVVGSTAFKHRKDSEGGAKPWLKFIHGFYTGFPEICWRKVGEVQKDEGLGTSLGKPYLWKALGDELIFSVPLRHPSHVRLYLKAFRSSLIESVDNWAGGEKPLPISFKGTAWLAGFPVFNSAIPLDVKEPVTPESEHFDFVGPLIDIGFRLSKFATPRKFVVSADIAWLVAENGETSAMNFHYDGRFPLKGVLNDRAYPVFWIDCHDGANGKGLLDSVEDKVLGRVPVSRENLRDLSCAFLDTVPGSIPKPFFHGEDIKPQFQPPRDFAGRLEDSKTEIRKIYEIRYDDRQQGAIPSSAEQEIKDLLRGVAKPKPALGRSARKKSP